jgi:tetratricopeptide (TPR) repeat protein
LPILFVVFAAAFYWNGRVVAERYILNATRSPEQVARTGWARLTGWLPNFLQRPLSAVVVGSTRPVPRNDLKAYIDRLEKAAAVFPYDGVLQLEMARRLFDRFRTERMPAADRVRLLEKALAANDEAFRTYFDVEAYGQMAWTHLELFEVLSLRNDPQAAVHLNKAIEVFNRALTLKPGDTLALERLAYIHVRLGRALQRQDKAKSSEHWNKAIDYAQRLLAEQHDNTNAFYLLGLAYDNMGLAPRAAMYYFKTLNTKSTLPTDRLLWLGERQRIIDHLTKQGFIKPQTSPKEGN